MALIVGLAVGLSPNNDKTPATVAATSDGTDIDLNETKTSPSTVPTKNADTIKPSAAPGIQAGIKDVQNLLVSEGITEEEDLSRDGYLQAIQWIAEQDELSLPIPHNETEYTRFVTRYTLALLYFVLDGVNWEFQLDFLTPTDYCDWNQIFAGTSGRVFRFGALCNADGVVHDLQIRKSISDMLLV